MNLRSQGSTLAPNSLANALNNSSSSEEFQETENIMANFSPEQFQQILAVIAGNQKGGSFTQCTARFKGQRDPAAVEEFLAAINVYKDLEKISDEDALRGMPLLLEGYAATWWIGVKDTITTFNGATNLNKKTFCPPVPD